jgi:lipoate-protein ligase A
MWVSEEGVQHFEKDLSMLREAEEGRFSWRVYEWEQPCVSLGMNQVAARDLLPDAPIGYAKRPTGGRAVLHGHDLTICLAYPMSSLGLEQGSRQLRAAYRVAVRPIVAAIRACGIECGLGEDFEGVAAENSRSADCFAHVGAHDVLNFETGQKVCGCALRMTESAVLVQASLPIREPEVDLSAIYVLPARVVWSEIDPAHLRQVFGNFAVPSQCDSKILCE